MWSERALAARAFLRAANGLGSRRIEMLWAFSSALAAKVRQPRPKRWGSSGQERVLAIAPHPDDEAMGCAGSLIRHGHLGDSVEIGYLTDGSLSQALGFDARSIAGRRKLESREAARRMGARSQWFGLHGAAWSDHAASAAIGRMLEFVRPTVIYAPSAIDYQPEHRRVAAVLAATLAQTSSTAEVRIYAVQVPLTPLLVNLTHDVSDLDAAIRRAMAAYATQRESVSRTFRLRRYAAGFYGAISQVEGFCSMAASTYARCTETHPRDSGVCESVLGAILLPRWLVSARGSRGIFSCGRLPHRRGSRPPPDGSSGCAAPLGCRCRRRPCTM